MVPLSFLCAAVLLLVLWRELTESDLARRNGFMAAFVVLLTLHLLLIGARYGYALDWIRLIQPFTAALLAPFAYLAFRNPQAGSAARGRLWLHLIPLLVVTLAVVFAIGLQDVTLGIINIGYGLALVALGRQGLDGLSWARLNRISGVERALWVVALLLFLSGFTDVAIAIDFWVTGGEHTARIAGISSVIGIVGLCAIAVALHRSAKRQSAPQSSTSELSESAGTDDGATDEHVQLLTAVDELINTSRIHHDPDLNLNRLSRKLGVPARQVSIAINRVSGKSVSQYINERRIVDACALLETTDMPVTSIMLASGYNTKSNFNREFKRVTGTNPSSWRESKTKAD